MNFGAIYVGLKKGWNVVKSISSDYIDMVETNNLFEVSMGKVVDEYGNLDEAQSKYYTQAIDFQNEMNEKLATNRAEMQKFQAMYFSMLKSQGIDLDKSYTMSESLTKAGYDIASLYNLTVDDAMDKLKSGLAGQVEPLRKIGIDISESALQKVLNEKGIEKSVQQLSYAEKEVARYIAIMEQAGQAQGDFAKTMDSSANQIKTFKNQLAELRQVAGAFIVNTFGNIITYATAVIMVVKEILKAFADLFGYDLNTSGNNLSSSIGVDDLNDGLATAAKKAKELKKQLMGFDEINNIDPNKQTSGSGSGGAATGIDSKLLDSLKKWDNKMANISGKAQEIRDKTLDWLGFVRDDNGGWKLGEGLTNFEKILEVVKAIGIAIAAWKISSAITGLLKSLGVLNGTQAFQIAFGVTLLLTGVYLMYKGIKHILEGDVDIFTILETALGGAMTTFGIVSILKGIVKSISLGNALKIGFGLTLALTGIFMEYRSVKKMLEGDLSLGTILKATGDAFLVGLGIWLLTGSPVLGLLGVAGVLSFNLGIEIGIVLKEVNWSGVKNKLVENKNKIFQLVEEAFGASGNINGMMDLKVIEISIDILTKLKKVNWSKFSEDMEDMKQKTSESFDNIKNTIVEKLTNAKKNAIDLSGKMSDGMNEKFTKWKQDFKTFEDWWNDKVAPWFTKEKWSNTAENAKNGINNKFTEWKENFKTFEDWWNQKVAPWFTLDKWKQAAGDAKSGIENKFTEFKNNFNPIRDWWNDKVAPWFSWEKWRQLGRDAVSGLENAFSSFSFPRIKLPHFSVDYKYGTWDSAAWKALGLEGRPELSVSWYANGGMPDMGELFVARESGPEMVGKIGNKTTVANNDQIVSAIKQGVYEAVTTAMANGSNEVHLDIRTDEGIIVKKASEGFSEYVMQTGELPFPVPVR